MASGKDDKALILDSSVSPKSVNIGKYEVRKISCSYVVRAYEPMLYLPRMMAKWER